MDWQESRTPLTTDNNNNIKRCYQAQFIMSAAANLDGKIQRLDAVLSENEEPYENQEA